MDSELIAVLDVGKTHARLLTVETGTGQVSWARQRECVSLTGGSFRELDVGGTESWLLQALAAAPDRERIRHIVPIAHGAAAVLIDARGRGLVALDYEDPQIEQVSAAYDPLRDRFTETYSPSLPLGLNLGRQWFFLQTLHQALWRQAQAALLYPQYWAWVLSGVRASEITSLGCHSDLWRPTPAGPSRLAIQQGWDRLLPQLHPAGAVLGLITPAVAQATGLSRHCQVYCGVHDSNASYLCHLAAHGTSSAAIVSAGKDFSVVSSGTWTVVLSRGAPLTRLRERQDMLANIDAYGNAVATARFMGGREYAHLAGVQSRETAPDRRSLAMLLDNGVMALPSFAPQGGPFVGRTGSIRNAGKIASAVERVTLATLYMTLMSDLLLDNLGATGDLIIDGPLALNPLFADLLQTLRPGSAVYASERTQGAAAAARYLVTGIPPTMERKPCTPFEREAAALAHYRNEWRAQVATPQDSPRSE